MQTAILIIAFAGLAAYLVGACALGIRRALRGRKPWGVAAFALFALVAAISAQKPDPTPTTGTITYPSNGDATYLTDNGSSFDADANTVTFNWTRVVAPDTANVYVSRQSRDDESGEWLDVYEGTFADTELPLTIQGTAYLVTNCNWMVYTDWTPGPTVETNGVWRTHWAWTQPDKAHILPTRATVAVNTRNVPDGYVECEYLQSSGSQFIDTDYVPNKNSAFLCDYAYMKLTVRQYAIGVLGTIRPLAVGMYINGSGYYAWVLQNGYGKLESTYVKATTNRVECTIDGYNNAVTWRKFTNDEWTTFYATKITTTHDNTAAFPLLIFKPNREDANHSNYNSSNMRCYAMKIWDTGVLIRDYIPALDPNGTPCLYDRVTRKPFYNSGTGTFGYKIKE